MAVPSHPPGLDRIDTCFVFGKMATHALCDDEMTSLRLDDGGCAAMTFTECEVIPSFIKSHRFERETV
ncbi:MAG: hypothetical protein Q4G70_05030 [Pseudomonadota bacterium]|nr:hypothetical protein [Pseudomonadota bacterium]